MTKSMSFIQIIRTILFYLLLTLSVLVWGCVIFIVFLFIPYHWLMRGFIQPWCRFVIRLCGLVGIRYKITGLENIPQTPCVFVAKHQSTWETIFFTSLIYPLSNVLKKELQFIPIFGWILALSRQVAINRSTPKEAFNQLMDKGCQLIKAGHYILIFPEGTRIPPGKIGRFSRGGATLAAMAEVSIVPVAHNAGEFWPKQGWAKYPGLIEVVIGQPILPKGSTPEEVQVVNKEAEEWLVSTMQQITSPAFLTKPKDVIAGKAKQD